MFIFSPFQLAMVVLFYVALATVDIQARKAAKIAPDVYTVPAGTGVMVMATDKLAVMMPPNQTESDLVQIVGHKPADK